MGRRRRNNLKVYVTKRRVNPIADVGIIRRTSSTYRLETSMTELRRSSGGGGRLSSFRNIIMTRSAKVRDICLISTKQKYQQQVEPEVLKQNKTNLMKERAQYDMFRAKSMGDQVITDTSTNDKRPAIHDMTKTNDKSKTNRQCKVDSRREGYIKSNQIIEDKQVKHAVNNNTLFKQLNAKKSTDRISRLNQTDSLVSLLSDTKAAKQNIYETVPIPRHPRRINENLHTHEVDSRISTDSKQDNIRKQKCIFTTHQTSDLTNRPQTPKIKKSVEMRNNVKLLHSYNAADILRRNKVDTRTNQDKTTVAVKSSPGVKAKAGKIKTRTEMKPQLLHPLWRRIPHRTLYGWSEQHQQLENVLYKKITEDPSLTSMYYPSETVYTEEQTKCGPGVRFLARPIVSTVEEVLALLKYYETCPNLLPKTPTYEEVFKLDEEKEDGEDSSDVESGYDGDDE